MVTKTSSERLADALERARRHWQKGSAEVVEPTPQPAPPPRITVAISREAGANGSQVAEAVGARLGWPVYNRDLLKKIAEEKGLRLHLLESVDEKRTSWLQECLEAFSSRPRVSQEAYAHYLVETLFSLAALGDCVIVGRGSAQVLPPETTLRVRLVGPLNDRIAAVSRKFAIPAEEAARWVHKTDRDRAAFVRDEFSRDPNDCHGYDLVINTSRLSAGAAADLIVQGVRELQQRQLAPVRS